MTQLFKLFVRWLSAISDADSAPPCAPSCQLLRERAPTYQ